LLKIAIEHEGSQIAFAKRHHIDRANLNMVLNGKRAVTDGVAEAIGLRKVYIAK
jgi:plasmid maintenance system antidote protein VapI